MKFELTTTIHNNCVFYGIRMNNLEINDISSDKDAVRCFCERLERGKVTETTLYDLIQDFME